MNLITEDATMKWQSFVPDVRAGAQAVLNEASGAAIDLILTAGARHGESVKMGEVFATHPGHHLYEMDHFLHRHVIIATTDYDEIEGYWRSVILADKDGLAFIHADFMSFEGRIAIKLTAENHSKESVVWVPSLLVSPNGRCNGAEVGDAIVSAEGHAISASFDSTWINTPPLDCACRYLNGMLLEWGRPCPDGRSFMNFFREWRIDAGQTDCLWIVAGDMPLDFVASDKPRLEDALRNLLARRRQMPFPLPDDPFEAGIKHIIAQTAANRIYPPKLECKGKPFAVFCPAPSFGYEYFWDAGFIAAGLAAVDPEKAEECISQYIPGEDGTVFPNLFGAQALIQVAAAWELYQATRDKGVLTRLNSGLHSLFLQLSGMRSLPDGTSLDEDRDGLIAPKGGGSGLDDAPSQTWTRGYSVGWARQNHYWTVPFEVNPTGKLIRTASVNMTAFAILSAKLLKLMGEVLGIAESPVYDEYISKAEAALEKHAWNERTGHYHWTVKTTHEQCPYYDLSGLSPLFSSSCPNSERTAAMAGLLIEKYLTAFGLTTVDRDAPFYRKAYWCGAIWMPFHWLFWKALLGLGRLEDADKIALSILGTYERNYRKLPLCYEKFDLETGIGCGEFSFSGLGTIILNLWAGYRKPATLTTGFMVIPDEVSIDGNLSWAKIRLTVKKRCDTTGILLVLKPKCKYTVCVGGHEQCVDSDSFGCLRISVPIGDGKADVRIECRENTPDSTKP